METKTLMRCFVFLGLVLLTALIGEFILASLRDVAMFKPHTIFPVTSIPQWFKNDAQIKNIASGKGGQSTPQSRIVSSVVLELKSGNTAAGKLVSENENWLTLDIEGSEVGFHRSEISAIKTSEPEA